MLGRGPAREVGATLSHQPQGEKRANAMNLRQVRSGQLIHGGANVKVYGVGLLGTMARFGKGTSGICRSALSVASTCSIRASHSPTHFW